MRCFVEQHDVQGQVVQVLSPAIQVSRSTLNRLVCDRHVALRGDERADRAFEQVLVDAAVLIEQSKRSLKAMHERLSLRMRQAFVVDAAKAIDEAYMAGLREERRVVDEPPQRKKVIHAPCVAV